MTKKVIGKVSFTPKGQYNSTSIYYRLDIVNYNGNAYVAIQDKVPANTLPTNTNYWQLFVESGESIDLLNTSYEYQLHTSGTSRPTGTWTTTIPTLEQGKYLWTRTTQVYTGNKTVVTYTVAYQGKDGKDGAKGQDGEGSVNTINNIGPDDGTNNVTLSISDLDIPVYNYGDKIQTQKVNDNDQIEIVGQDIRCFGYITENSTNMFLTLIFPKLFKDNSQLKITRVTGGIRTAFSGYVEGLSANLTPYLNNNQILWDCNASFVNIWFHKTTGPSPGGFVRSNDSSNVITNNIPVSGYVSIIGEIVQKT